MTTSTIAFDVIDALFDQAEASLSNIVVSDGFAVTQDPGDYLMVGITDPDAEGLSPAADSQQDWATLGDRQREEVGVVHCVAESWNGDGDLRAARTSVKATVDAVAGLLAADPTLGGLAELLWVGYGRQLGINQAQTASGAIAQVTFTVGFRARIHTT